MLPTAASQRDVYANLLRDTRALRRDQATARDAWFAALPWERKEETLFELEMLLKGIACFGNPRNHPGAFRRGPEVAHDFGQDLRIVRQTVEQTVNVVRSLLGDRDRVYSFSRYLESLLPEDSERSQLVKEQLAQDTPIEALWVLRNAFTGHQEIIDGLLRIGRISHRLYHGIHGTITREIGRNTYFNPLVSLEFRSEFDRIRNGEVLEALETVASETPHRVAALTFLTLFRGLRYLDLVDRYASDPATVRMCSVIFAVFRSDMRVLTRYLIESAAAVMAEGLERELMLVDAHEVKAHYDQIAHIASMLASLRASLVNLGESLRVEVRRVFERDLPSIEESPEPSELAPKVIVAAASLRASLQHAVRGLCVELRPEAAPPELAEGRTGQREASERLRREVWIFSQILRAFLAKAKAPRGEPNAWEASASYKFVREFLKHFRAIGYQLVRSSDYERLDPFLAALEDLREMDFLDAERRMRALEECKAFHRYLEELFNRIGERIELTKIPFNKQIAVDTLKIYLGAA